MEAPPARSNQRPAVDAGPNNFSGELRLRVVKGQLLRIDVPETWRKVANTWHVARK